MEEAMYSIGSIRAMEVIDIVNGVRLGYIRDLKIDCNDYKILSIILPSPSLSWFSRDDGIEIPWSKVKKIGVDVILVDCDGILIDE